MDIISLIGFTAGICVTVSVIPQIITVWKTKKVQNVSLFMFVILTFGIMLWIIYGILKKDIPIIVTNSVSLLLNITMLYFIKRYEIK
ncbi:MAG: SemiSWEET transporter [Flavobacterium sp.]